jgi:hypothetical protein
MKHLTFLEQKKFMDLFDMSSGYLMDLSNTDFEAFFRNFNISIYDEKYNFYGPSKAKRLRAFWEKEPAQAVGQVLQELLTLWSYKNPNSEKQSLFQECQIIVSCLLGLESKISTGEEDFVKKDFGDISIAKLPLEPSIILMLENRFAEVKKCLNIKAPLATILLSGSILEGILLGIAKKNEEAFNRSSYAPKDKEGKVKKFSEWKLGELIDAASEINFLGLDVKKYSHSLREFRNYIHPHQELNSNFSPRCATAVISLKVLEAAIADLSGQG